MAKESLNKKEDTSILEEADKILLRQQKGGAVDWGSLSKRIPAKFVLDAYKKYLEQTRTAPVDYWLETPAIRQYPMRIEFRDDISEFRDDISEIRDDINTFTSNIESTKEEVLSCKESISKLHEEHVQIKNFLEMLRKAYPVSREDVEVSAEHTEDELLLSWEQYWEKHKDELFAKYKGKYVAICNDEVYDSDEDLTALAQRVYEALGYRPIFMPYVGEEKQIYYFHSY